MFKEITIPIIEILSLTGSGIEIFSTLTEVQLQNRVEPGKGLLIAESPKVIHVAPDAGYEPLALLCEQEHIAGGAAGIIEHCGDMPVYTGEGKLLATLTRYTLTRGVLCAMHRWALPSIEEVCRRARRVVVIEGVVDTINIGTIFHFVAALGIGAILLTRNSCSPLNRRAVKVSMGSAFLIPWTWLNGFPNELRKLDFRAVAMTLMERSISVDNPILATKPKLAIVVGAERDSLQNETINETDYIVHIPMVNDVDSLNVATAFAIAFWQPRVQNDAILPPLPGDVHM